MVYKKILLLLITFINFSLFPIFATEENQNLSDSNLQPEEEAFEEEAAEEEFSVEEKWQIARNMKRAGIPTEQITLFTGLPIEEITTIS